MSSWGSAARWYAGAWWVAAVAWMVVIFVLSSQPDADPEGGRDLHVGAYKLAHLVEYFVLGFLFAGATRHVHVPRALWWAWVAVVMYAIGDEIHQAFVPGRSPLLSDVGIDALGGFLGVLAYRLYEAVRRGDARRLHLWPLRRARGNRSDPA